MIAEKDATWEVQIYYQKGQYNWAIITEDDIGLYCNTHYGKTFVLTRQQAIANFKKYAKLNRITKYKINE